MDRDARPGRVVHGRSRVHESIFFAEKTRLLQLADEVRAVKRCSSIGEASRLVASLQLTSVPGLDDEADADADAPYDWTESVEVAEGDRPPMLTQPSTGVFLPGDERASAMLRDRAGARLERTVLDDDVLLVPPGHERALLDVVDDLGVEHERDDSVVDVFERHFRSD